MKKYLLLILISGFALSGATQETHWQQQVDYTIRVTLNDSLHTLNGFISIQYQNRSPDTLYYIWFHLWANAFKSDKTAYSDQLLENGQLSFYFSSSEEKGYINQLDFRVNDTRIEPEDHPTHLDIVKLPLPSPLLPDSQVTVTTPFHVKLPRNFSDGGHTGQSYEILQWFPKPAVYDQKGWHPMPFLQQGAPYCETGNFNVALTLPRNYVVAATGILQEEDEKEWLRGRSSFTWTETRYRKKTKGGSFKTIREIFPASDPVTKTLHYVARNAQDFVWCADKRFIVQHDTCSLVSGKTIDVYVYYTQKSKALWINGMDYAKKAVHYYASVINTPPFSSLSIVAASAKMYGASAHPALAVIANNKKTPLKEETVSRAIGQTWMNNLLSANARVHPWMNNSISTFFERQPLLQKPVKINNIHSIHNYEKTAFETMVSVKKDQPVETPAGELSTLNYWLSSGYKGSEWLHILKSFLGKDTFDSCIQVYHQQWQFGHPYPEDFKQIFSTVSNKNTDSIFRLLNLKGDFLPRRPTQIRTVWLAKADPERSYHYIGILPALGFNLYDKLMTGVVIHNYNLPFNRFKFVVAPLYATGSRQISGIGRASYTWYPKSRFYAIEAGSGWEKFTGNTYVDEEHTANYLGFNKLSPYIRFTFNNHNPRSRLHKFIQFKTYFLNTDVLKFTWDTVTMKSDYSIAKQYSSLGQLRWVTDNSRALYPYRTEWQFEVSKDFGRLVYTGNYYFNYPENGGMNVRWFAGKFFYFGGQTSLKRSRTDPYHLNMSTPKGDEDYTYNNYFMGRNEFNGFFSQQVMMRDGGFKTRTDLLNSKVGKTDNWLLALNFTSSLHRHLPVKLFFDLGSYSEGSDDKTGIPKILFDAGFQVSLCKDIVNIYVPLIYSKIYQDYYKTIPGNNFWQRISFSMDIQNISFRKLNLPLPF